MSDQLAHIDRSQVWHPYTSLQTTRENILITSGAGAYLYDRDGNTIIDAVASWWVNLHGHGNKAIADAIHAQALKLEHVIFAGFTHQPAIDLADALLKILPGKPSRIFYSDNGSTAVEVAIKMALQFWFNKSQKKTKIIALEGAYHGDTFGAMAVAERTLFTQPFSDKLFQVDFIPFPHGGNEAEVLSTFTQLIQHHDVAAFIYEPLLQGAAGMRTYAAATLHKLIALAKEREVICIADEVLTGFGRTGKLFASDHVDLPPDIITLSKGITGGALPLGVTACNAWIESAFMSGDSAKTFYHGHSYTANPICCAAAIASLQILLSQKCQQEILRISESHKAFGAKISSHPRVRKLCQLGTVISIEMDLSEPSNYFHSSRERIYDYFLKKNILLRPLGNTVYILPPYVILQEDLEKIYQAITDFLEEV